MRLLSLGGPGALSLLVHMAHDGGFLEGEVSHDVPLRKGRPAHKMVVLDCLNEG